MTKHDIARLQAKAANGIATATEIETLNSLLRWYGDDGGGRKIFERGAHEREYDRDELRRLRRLQRENPELCITYGGIPIGLFGL